MWGAHVSSSPLWDLFLIQYVLVCAISQAVPCCRLCVSGINSPLPSLAPPAVINDAAHRFFTGLLSTRPICDTPDTRIAAARFKLIKRSGTRVEESGEGLSRFGVQYQQQLGDVWSIKLPVCTEASVVYNSRVGWSVCSGQAVLRASARLGRPID